MEESYKTRKVSLFVTLSILEELKMSEHISGLDAYLTTLPEERHYDPDDEVDAYVHTHTCPMCSTKWDCFDEDCTEGTSALCYDCEEASEE